MHAKAPNSWFGKEDQTKTHYNQAIVDEILLNLANKVYVRHVRKNQTI